MSQDQDANRKFYDNIGTRIRFIRKARGLSLQALSDGAASTAKSWEEGSIPRPDQWEIVAHRLGLSVSFVFLGQPKSRADFDFIAKYAEELPPPPTRSSSNSPIPPSEGGVEESPAARDYVMAIEARNILEQAIAAAGNDAATLGWIVGQLRIHLSSIIHSRKTPASAAPVSPLTAPPASIKSPSRSS